MRIEAAYTLQPTNSVILVMLKQAPTRWWTNRFKIFGVLLIFGAVLLFQYAFDMGAAMNNITPKKPASHIAVADTPTLPDDIRLLEVETAINGSSADNAQPKAGSIPSVPPTTTTKPTTTNGTAAVAKMVPQGNLTECPVLPPVLVGPIKVWFDYPSFEKLAELYPYLEPGGHSKPKDCKSRHRVAIIIPYRDREQHLRGFLHNLHSLLTKQQLDYTIFIVEPVPNETFNRAKLMNVGFVEANKLYDWQCYIFHDVDLLPEDDRNLYTCPEQPRHMSVAVDKFGYKLPYTDIFGGVSALTREQFVKVNGFSNDYWGWGGEDDDMATRVKSNGYTITRYAANVARYKMVKHTTEKTNPVNKCRYKLLYKTKKRMGKDGLGNLEYSLQKLEMGKLYTRVLVDLKEKESREKLKGEGLC